MPSKRFLIMAGGTGGHVYPALATAQYLVKQGDEVCWMGSRNGMEEGIVAKAGIPFYGVSVSGLRGKGLKSLLLAPFKLVLSVWQALSVLRTVRPDCVLGMGGFASGPGGLAARLLGKPLVVHEQNAIAGMTNRYLAKVATLVLEAFPGAFDPMSKLHTTGNPIREDICQLYFSKGVMLGARDQVNVLVLGGSLGAQAINECLPESMALLPADIRPQLRHQTGKNKFEPTRDKYQALGVDVDLREYIEDMADAYEWADIVICRAGALTVSELCAAGLGAILIPYPHAVDDHQTANARWMETAGAAWLLPQSELHPEGLAEILGSLMKKPQRIQHLADAARKLGQPEATEKVAGFCRSVCHA